MFVWIAFVLAQIADVVTTHIGLSRGAAEGNPVIARFMTVFGPKGWIIVKLVLACGVAWALWVQGQVIFIWLITIVTAIFVINNILVLRNMKGK